MLSNLLKNKRSMLLTNILQILKVPQGLHFINSMLQLNAVNLSLRKCHPAFLNYDFF
jgi:hypothetical protein